jgi:hypothetical protein
MPQSGSVRVGEVVTETGSHGSYPFDVSSELNCGRRLIPHRRKAFGCRAFEQNLRERCV